MKRCSICDTKLKLSEFPVDSRRKGGHAARCKACQRDINREHYRRNSERVRAKTAAWRAANHQKKMAIDRAYRAGNAEYWKQHRVRAQRRRAKKAGIPAHDYARASVLALHPRSCCAYCGTRLTLETLCVDHVRPITPREGDKQGCDCLANLAPACATCNSRKNNRPPSLDLFIDLWDRARREAP
jgi:5-methylcytosine-specific restriction endonuclease McrA